MTLQEGYTIFLVNNCLLPASMLEVQKQEPVSYLRTNVVYI
ncbi:unnamed protein product [Rhodiola kirilowii]